MSSSLQTVCRTLRAPLTSQAQRLGASRLRQLSTTDAPRDQSGAVRDAIMDKLWISQVYPPVAPEQSSSAVTSASPATVFGSREPPLGTSAFDPSAAPRWSELSNSN